MRMSLAPLRLWMTGLVLAVTSIACVRISVGEEPRLGAYISTGDNQWVGSWLPIDSPASIEAAMEFLSRLGVKRIYWRGLQGALYVDTAREREENVRYASFWKWTRKLYAEVDPDRTAAEAAHRADGVLGRQRVVRLGQPGGHALFWRFSAPRRITTPAGASRMGSSGSTRRAASGRSYRTGLPGSAQALVDLHLKYVRRDGYDGVLFLTYAENYSTRFQDEFGYNEPVVAEFKRRTGVDLRTQAFSRSGSRYDWYALRGEYVTAFFRS